MRLKIQSFGTNAEGIELKGDPRNPEPDHTRIMFPGGEVDVARTTDNEYWVHISINDPELVAYDPFRPTARLVDARADLINPIDGRPVDLKPVLEKAYHFAVRVGDIKQANQS